MLAPVELPPVLLPLVVDATLVVFAVTTVVLVFMATKEVLVTVEFMCVAEKEEHSAKPTEAAMPISVPLQLVRKQPVTDSGLRAHWQDTSLGAQDAAAMAARRQEV